MRRRLKDALKRLMFRAYRLGTRLGLHVVPVHYYSPLPSLIELEATKGVWAGKSSLPGVRADPDEQVQSLLAVCRPYQREYVGNEAYETALSRNYGPGYGYVEAQALHAVVRHFKPARIIEVGSGISTHCILTALELNRQEDGATTDLTCIEPYPAPWLRQTAAVTLIREKVQAVSTDVFGALAPGDLLFIDSSHTVKPGGDVNYLVLEVLPRLAPGVLIHFHDIFLPYDYQRNVLKTFLHWSETSLVRAFLTFNDRVEIVFCLSLLHYERPQALKEVFPDYEPQSDENGLLNDSVRPFESAAAHFPSSLYLRMR